MPSNWLRLMIVIGLGFLTSAQAFAQGSLPGSNTVDASEYQNSRQMKSGLPGMSEGKSRIWNSSDKKFEIKGGIVQRYWMKKDPKLDLGMLDTDYQLGFSFFSGPGEFELAFAGGKSGGNVEYLQNTIDRDKLILWYHSFVFIDDVPVKLNYTEDIRLWNFQLHYWHNLGNRKPTSFQIGPGAHFYVLEKHTKMQVQYEDWGPDFLILNPHYQNSELHSTTMIPGISLGARGRLDISSKGQDYGSILVGGEWVLAKPTNGISIGGQPLNKFNSLNFTLQYAYAFE